MTGTIKKLAQEKGYGFITVDGEAKDVFFHAKALVDVAFEQLNEGDTVSFDIEEVEKNGESKKNAVNVSRA